MEKNLIKKIDIENTNIKERLGDGIYYASEELNKYLNKILEQKIIFTYIVYPNKNHYIKEGSLNYFYRNKNNYSELNHAKNIIYYYPFEEWNFKDQWLFLTQNNKYLIPEKNSAIKFNRNEIYSQIKLDSQNIRTFIVIIF